MIDRINDIQLNLNTVNNHLATENTNDTLIRLPKQFIWENDSSQKFKTALQTRDIQRMILDFLLTIGQTNTNISIQLDIGSRCALLLSTKESSCGGFDGGKW